MTTLSHSLKQGLVGRRNAGLFATLLAMVDVRRQRRQLRDLDDATLADLGLTRIEAIRESRRPAWDMPARRRC